MIQILMLVNWKVEYGAERPKGKQPPDYYMSGEPYWFFRWFRREVHVDVVDIRSCTWLENVEKNKLRFYIWQTLRIIPRMHHYDIIISHGAQSGIVLSLWRRLFRGKEKHLLFDIGAFNSAAESGAALKLMQKASKSLDGVIYHTSGQIDYYKKCFPWLVDKSKFIRFGTDSIYFSRENRNKEENYILCVGYQKRDWNTLISAYDLMVKELERQGNESEIPELRLIGKSEIVAMRDDGRRNENRGCGRISAYGFMPLEELISNIQNCMFAVLPLENCNYSFGQMTLLQQMALGKPVIAARVPSMIDYIEEGKTALCYTAGDAADLCEKMLHLYCSGESRKQIGELAALYVKNQYNEQTMARQIEDYIEQILKA